MKNWSETNPACAQRHSKRGVSAVILIGLPSSAKDAKQLLDFVTRCVRTAGDVFFFFSGGIGHWQNAAGDVMNMDLIRSFAKSWGYPNSSSTIGSYQWEKPGKPNCLGYPYFRTSPYLYIVSSLNWTKSPDTKWPSCEITDADHFSSSEDCQLPLIWSI